MKLASAGLNYPQIYFFAERGETSPFARLGDLDTDSGVLAGGHLSLVFGTDLPAPVLGADMSTIEFVGAFQNVWGSTAASFFDNGPGERYGWVEMPYVSGYGTIDGSTLETTTDRTARYIKNQALLKTSTSTLKYSSVRIFAIWASNSISTVKSLEVPPR